MFKLSKKDKKIILYISIGVVLLFFIWWILSLIINSTLFPSPIKVIPLTFSYFGKIITYEAILGTFARLAISFIISLVFGVLIGAFAGKFYRIESILKPIIGFLRSIPTSAVVLILIVLLKPFWTPIIVTCLVLFPLFYSATLEGVKNINPALKDDIKIYEDSFVRILFKIYIPLIWDYILLAIIQSIGLGLKVSIMAEILGGSNQINGLGRMIHNEYIYANAANVMALSLIAIFLLAVVDIVFHIIKRRINNG